MRAGTLDDLLEVLADAIIEAQPQKRTAALAGFSEKHVSQMLTGKVDGSLRAWQRMLDAAGLSVRVDVYTAPGEAVTEAQGGAE